jgi:hypothetical protein
LLLIGLFFAGPRELPAQATWEYSPYSVKVWLAMDASAELTPGLAQRIGRVIRERAWVVAGATWQVDLAACPASLAADAARDPALVTVDAVGALDPDLVKQDDKLFLLGIRDELTGLTIAVRELDCRTRLWQPVVTRHVSQPGRVAEEAFTALLDAFVPFGRIDSAKGKEAVVRVRADGLITGEQSPARIAEQDVLVPIIRRNDRLGEPLENGIQQAAWTFLTVAGRKGNQWQCQVYSGMTSPLGGRSSARTMRLALLAKPRLETRPNWPSQPKATIRLRWGAMKSTPSCPKGKTPNYWALPTGAAGSRSPASRTRCRSCTSETAASCWPACPSSPAWSRRSRFK